MLGIVLSCNIVEFQGKLMNQTWENGKNLEKTKIRAAKIFFFFKNLASSVPRYHNQLYQKKLIIQSWENLVTHGRTDRRTDRRKRVISYNTVRLTLSVQNNS